MGFRRRTFLPLQKTKFKNEYIELMQQYNIDYNEKYLFVFMDE